MAAKSKFYPVILAGGRGTRFWPRSRRSSPKQVLSLDGRRSMLQQTLERLRPLAPVKNAWVITNSDLRRLILRQAPKLDPAKVIAEPVGRNTAPAIGLAAFLLLRQEPEAVLGVFPADHVVGDEKRFREVVEQAIEVAGENRNMVVMGMTPTRPETGYGYIESGEKVAGDLYRVTRFTEKPNAERAREFVTAGNHFWNSGIFIWKASTIAAALREHLRESTSYLEEIAAAWGTKRFQKTFAKLYLRCQNISIDYAVLEPRSAKGQHASDLFCIPAEFGWNDLGSWAALHEHALRKSKRPQGGNVLETRGDFVLEAGGNYVHAPNKFVAAIGVKNLVVVDTEDALLIAGRENAQDVGKIVKYLEEKKKRDLL